MLGANWKHQSGLHKAARNRNIDAMKILVDGGTNVNGLSGSQNNETSLYAAGKFLDGAVGTGGSLTPLHAVSGEHLDRINLGEPMPVHIRLAKTVISTAWNCYWREELVSIKAPCRWCRAMQSQSFSKTMYMSCTI